MTEPRIPSREERDADRERNTHPSDASGELDNRVGTPSPSELDEAWNQPATTSLVLGIVAFVIQLVAWGAEGIPDAPVVGAQARRASR
jgi:hypothetical protein